MNIEDDISDFDSYTASQQINLKKRYPTCYRIVIKKTFPWLLGCGLVLLLVAFVRFSAVALVGDKMAVVAFDEMLLLITVVVSLVALAKLAYEILYRRSRYWGIEAGHFVVSKGIILKHRGLFPLSRITDVYLDRTIGDLIFGLWTLHVSTPTAQSNKFAVINGFTKATALALQTLLTSYLEASHLHVEQIMSDPVSNSTPLTVDEKKIDGAIVTAPGNSESRAHHLH